MKNIGSYIQESQMFEAEKMDKNQQTAADILSSIVNGYLDSIDGDPDKDDLKKYIKSHTSGLDDNTLKSLIDASIKTIESYGDYNKKLEESVDSDDELLLEWGNKDKDDDGWSLKKIGQSLKALGNLPQDISSGFKKLSKDIDDINTSLKVVSGNASQSEKTIHAMTQVNKKVSANNTHNLDKLVDDVTDNIPNYDSLSKKDKKFLDQTIRSGEFNDIRIDDEGNIQLITIDDEGKQDSTTHYREESPLNDPDVQRALILTTVAVAAGATIAAVRHTKKKRNEKLLAGLKDKAENDPDPNVRKEYSEFYKSMLGTLCKENGDMRTSPNMSKISKEDREDFEKMYQSAYNDKKLRKAGKEYIKNNGSEFIQMDAGSKISQKKQKLEPGEEVARAKDGTEIHARRKKSGHGMTYVRMKGGKEVGYASKTEFQNARKNEGMISLRDALMESFTNQLGNLLLAIDYPDLDIIEVIPGHERILKGIYYKSKIVRHTNGIVLVTWNDRNISFSKIADNLKQLENKLIRKYHEMLKVTDYRQGEVIPESELSFEDPYIGKTKYMSLSDYFEECIEFQLGSTWVMGNIFFCGMNENDRRLPQDNKILDNFLIGVNNTHIDRDSSEAWAILDMDKKEVIAAGGNINFRNSDDIVDPEDLR